MVIIYYLYINKVKFIYNKSQYYLLIYDLLQKSCSIYSDLAFPNNPEIFYLFMILVLYVTP